MAGIKVHGENGEILTEVKLPTKVVLGEPLVLNGECGNGATYSVKLEALVIREDKLYRNEEWLREAYTNNGKTMAELATMFSVSPMTICTWLDKFSIETRSRGRRS
tara:strand:- start:3448 stop:3765 length:318 start_codon:yes stop_codon:yes gene_type:complete